mmetsp:Transcript_43283/g.129817  ORF Transcript_43283/g.129817 Transcript_43283/m.129817 type:complete len:315 (+) Transcript_43283:493-1437(+)
MQQVLMQRVRRARRACQTMGVRGRCRRSCRSCSGCCRSMRGRVRRSGHSRRANIRRAVVHLIHELAVRVASAKAAGAAWTCCAHAAGGAVALERRRGAYTQHHLVRLTPLGAQLLCRAPPSRPPRQAATIDAVVAIAAARHAATVRWRRGNAVQRRAVGARRRARTRWRRRRSVLTVLAAAAKPTRHASCSRSAANARARSMRARTLAARTCQLCRPVVAVVLEVDATRVAHVRVALLAPQRRVRRAAVGAHLCRRGLANRSGGIAAANRVRWRRRALARMRATNGRLARCRSRQDRHRCCRTRCHRCRCRGHR